MAESDFRDVGSHLVETIATIDERYASEFALDRGEAGLAGWCTPELLRIRAKRRALIRALGTRSALNRCCYDRSIWRNGRGR